MRADARSEQHAEATQESLSNSWTQQRIHWLFLATHYLGCTDASPASLQRDGKIDEDDEEIMHAISNALSLAGEAETQWLGQRPKRARAMADEALALFNLAARAVGAPLRDAGSPEPVEPESLRKAREEGQRKEKELIEQRATTWSAAKIQVLGNLIDTLAAHLKESDEEELFGLHRAASDAAYHGGNYVSGPRYEKVAIAAEKCLAAYNRLVPAKARKTVRDL